MKNVLKEVLQERNRQDQKWGQQNHTPIEWIAILTEEVGEACKEAVDFHFDKNLSDLNSADIYAKQLERLRKYRSELIQVSAVAVAMVECLDRNVMNL